MTKIMLWQLMVLQLWPHPTWSKVYPRPITKRTPQLRRLWEGMESNTGTNFGGWLFIVHHAGELPICGASYYAPILMIASGNCIGPHRYDLEGTSVEPTFTDENIYGMIDTVYTHQKFIQGKLFMDVALLRLQYPIRGLTTEFIKLCTVSVMAGMKMTAYAWGFDSMDVYRTGLDARSGTVIVQRTRDCLRRLRDAPFRLSSSNFCVTLSRDPRKCLYDGGAPLTFGNELCGVVSFGPRCNNLEHPGVYTDINKVSPFIRSIEREMQPGSSPSDAGVRKWLK
ncbi:seminase-like [Drosophila ficusphila]|uniref:seminase-like n=1 Tax=Drosophila ficusphila TaxID=30025 RepID=UPI0007E71F21|nr:seminase-like [Drosophila ficusphila]